MADNTGIEWCDATVNFWIGCTKVSAACDHCYAEAMASRFGLAKWGHGEKRVRTKGAIATAFRLDRKAQRLGRRLKVFSNSMSDFFDAEVDDSWRDEAMAAMALCGHLDWLILTKRPKVMLSYCSSRFSGEFNTYISDAMADLSHPYSEDHHQATIDRTDLGKPLPNVWLGVTAENQDMADLRIPELLRTPAAKRFLSCEPLLGAIRFRDEWLRCPGGAEYGRGLSRTTVHAGCCESHPRIDWIIAGGESGPQARPMHPNWARSLRDQCVAAGVPFFFKQWGEWGFTGDVIVGARDAYFWPFNDDGSVGPVSYLIGKERAGRLLDGREWNDMPN